MSPIKGLSEKRRMPRIGKIHLGIKKTNSKGVEYPSATDYFVFPEPDALGGELREQLIQVYGEKPKELKVIFPLEEEELIASQYYRCYTRTRGLVCRGDGEVCMRMIDKETGALPTKESGATELKEMACTGQECPDYTTGNCREVMNLQFMLPNISGLGVWQIDTSSINSIRNINSCLDMIRAVYGRVNMVPLILTIEPIEVTPPGGTKKTVHVLNLRSTDTMIEAAINARKAPMELIAGEPDHEQAEKDIENLWPTEEKDRMLTQGEAESRMTPGEIDDAKEEDTEDIIIQEIPEPEPEPEATESTKKASKAESKGDVSKIDKSWLLDSVNKLKWDIMRHLKDTYQVKATAGEYLLEVIAKLTPEQQEELTKEIQDRLDLL